METKVRILVACHKDTAVPASDILVPIHVGAALGGKSPSGWLRDDSGDNISEKNASFCELTAIYWAWKNLDADYYGLCHYRRYFNFSDTLYPQDEWGNVVEPYLTQESAQRYGLASSTISQVVSRYDMLVTQSHDVKKWIPRYKSVYEQYAKAPFLHISDLDVMLEIIDDQFPEFSSVAHAYCQGNLFGDCNMSIFRKDIFHEYCSFLFGVLFEWEKCVDMSAYTAQELRTPGHLAERLTWIFYLWKIQQDPTLRTQELQCVLFEHTDTPFYLPAIQSQAVPVVFATDEKFAPLTGVCLQSLITHASPERTYDIVILSSDITAETKARFIRQVSSYPHISLRWYNPQPLVAGFQLSTNGHDHISVETYYRFLIPRILPDYHKVLYLDGDIIIKTDVARLYDIELGTSLLGAVRDPEIAGQVAGGDRAMKDYLAQVIGLADAFQYLQAGVLLMNTRELTALHSVEEWLALASERKFRYNDQDILNRECKSRVFWLPMEFNVLANCGGRRIAIINKAPHRVSQEYMQSRRRPHIIHYAGYEKPWLNMKSDYASEFWHYARHSAFFEIVMSLFLQGQGNGQKKGKEKASSWRERIFPRGSWRRKIAKRIYYVVKRS